MKAYNDGNTGNNKLVFLKDGVIHSSLPLDIEYNHDRCAFELGLIGAQLLEMAQRYYDEVQTLKAENSRLNKRASRPKLKPSVIAKEDLDYKKAQKKTNGKKNPKKSKQPITFQPKQTLPTGARFKGYKTFTVQEIEILVHKIAYRRVTISGSGLSSCINSCYSTEKSTSTKSQINANLF